MQLRVTTANHAKAARGEHVLYWMIAARRTTHNFALDHAIARAHEVDRPLLVLEALRAGYPWACDRFHAFVLDGMADNARAFAKANVTYLPYVEPEPGRGAGLLEALAKRACVVVTDEQPGFFLPRMVAAAATRLAVPLEVVDGNGLLPLRATTRAFATAASFRRELQRIVHPYLGAFPAARLRAQRSADIPGAVLRRWPAASAELLAGRGLDALPIDHAIAPTLRGGATRAARLLDRFVGERLAHYDDRNHPDAEVTSELSPYLHFGHISAHAVIARVWADAAWDPSRLAPKPTGSREGWWGLPPTHEAFLDQLVTWRELGYHFCFHRRDANTYGALPEWAQATLAKHARDPRPHRYTRAQLDRAETGDPIWNAAQRQLVVEGRIHNYLRMLWGKKILEWSASPRAAFATMIELNNRYAIDGRDPNSFSGIAWTLGLFDRPWGPERPIFGTVRYMSSDATRKKLRMTRYLERWSTRSTD